MKSINKDMQDYFIKLAPDFSVFDMAEKYFYDNDLPEGVFKDVFRYDSAIPADAETNTTFYRGMFLIHLAGDIVDSTVSVVGVPEDEYTVFPYNNNSRILIAIQSADIIITSNDIIEVMIGVAF